MSKFTVIVARPEYLSDAIGNEHITDVYVAAVESEDRYAACKAALTEVYTADKKYGLRVDSSADYTVVLCFNGHPKISLFGWQL